MTDTPNRVAVMDTHTGEELVLRSNPTEEEVLGFITEHNRRYHAGEPGGPSGIPSFLIKSATFYDDEIKRSNPVEIALPEDA